MDVRTVRLIGWLGFIAPVVGFAFIFLAIQTAPWFSWSENALSDLGVEDVTAAIFNYGLIATASMVAAFSLGLQEFTDGDRVGRIGSSLFLLAAVFLFFIGVFPETAGRIHFYVSVAFFVTLSLTVMVLSVYVLRQGMKGEGVAVLAAGLFSAMIWTLNWDGAAIPEAISALMMAVTSAIFGYRMTRLR
jgi:hypothetical membrane protein